MYFTVKSLSGVAWRGVGCWDLPSYLVEWDDGDPLGELASLQQGLGCLVIVNNHLQPTQAHKGQHRATW